MVLGKEVAAVGTGGQYVTWLAPLARSAPHGPARTVCGVMDAFIGISKGDPATAAVLRELPRRGHHGGGLAATFRR